MPFNSENEKTKEIMFQKPIKARNEKEDRNKVTMKEVKRLVEADREEDLLKARKNAYTNENKDRHLFSKTLSSKQSPEHKKELMRRHEEHENDTKKRDNKSSKSSKM